MRVCLVAVAAATLTVSACGAGASFPVYPTIPEASAPHAGQPAAEPSSAPPQRALDSVLRSVQPVPARLPHTMPDPQPRPPQRSVVAAELPPHRSSAPEWRCDEWVETAVYVGWPEEQLPKLSYAVYRESRCDPDAQNTDDPTRIGSLGLIQINGFWCLPSQYWPEGWLQTHGILDECDELFDPETNLRAALAIWENSGWGPWNL